MSAYSVLPPTGFTTRAERSEYFAGIARNELSECHSMLPRLKRRCRESRSSGAPSRPRFETSFIPTWSRRSSGAVMFPPRASSSGPKCWLNAICCSSVKSWSWKTRTAYRSIPASIAATSSPVSGRLTSTPETSPDHHVLVEILVAMPHAAHVEGDARLHARERAAHVVGDRDFDPRLDLEL